MSSVRIHAEVKVTGIAPQAMIDQLGPKARNEAAAQSVTILVQRRLTDYDRAHPNQLGGRRTHHFRALAQSTNWSATDTEGVVAVSDFRASQTILGGIIRPGKGTSFKTGKPTSALTAAASADSYGERAQKFEGRSQLIWFKHPHGKLLGMIVDKTVQRLGAGKVRRNGSIMGGKLDEKGVFRYKRVLFWLLSEANQKGNPESIPNDSEIVQGAVAGVSALVKDVFQNSQKAAAVVWQGK